MRLRQLFESPGKTAAFAFGRLNPATNGHELLVQEIVKQPGDAFLFLSDRPAKLPSDPLSAEEKLDWAQKSFNNIAVGLAKNALVAADRLYKMGYTNLIYLEGEAKKGTVIKKYNGVEAAMHNYNFDNIDLVRLERDPDDPGARGMSATKLRQTVVDNDFDAFQAGITQAAQPYAEDMFKKLHLLLSVNEAQMVGHNTLLSQPKLTLVIDTPGDLDWYKLGQHYPTLAQQDPKEYGNEDSDTVMTFSTPEEMSHMKRMLDKMGAKYKEIGGTHQHPEVHEKWSTKYKKSINCNNPKGFSQRAHCQGRKK